MENPGDAEAKFTGCEDTAEPWLYRRELTIIVLEQDGQHFTAVQLVGIKGHLGL